MMFDSHLVPRHHRRLDHRDSETLEDLLVREIRRSTYWKITRPIRRSGVTVMNLKDSDVDFLFNGRLAAGSSGAVKRVRKRVARPALKVVKLSFRPFGIPSCAFLPLLDLCLTKVGRAHQNMALGQC